MNSIGIILPISRGHTGYFNQSYDTMTQIKSNITNLLSTNSYERRMQPTFSSGIRELLFDQNTENLHHLIQSVISSKISEWIPGVVVENVELVLPENEKDFLVDTYKIYIKVRFSVNTQSDWVSVAISPMNT